MIVKNNNNNNNELHNIALCARLFKHKFCLVLLKIVRVLRDTHTHTHMPVKQLSYYYMPQPIQQFHVSHINIVKQKMRRMEYEKNTIVYSFNKFYSILYFSLLYKL